MYCFISFSQQDFHTLGELKLFIMTLPKNKHVLKIGS